MSSASTVYSTNWDASNSNSNSNNEQQVGGQFANQQVHDQQRWDELSCAAAWFEAYRLQHAQEQVQIQ
ncbi:hypothetical protein HDU76_012128, partial [Blyttiomyces sp. JEL0837]